MGWSAGQLPGRGVCGKGFPLPPSITVPPIHSQVQCQNPASLKVPRGEERQLWNGSEEGAGVSGGGTNKHQSCDRRNLPNRPPIALFWDLRTRGEVLSQGIKGTTLKSILFYKRLLKTLYG